MKCNGNLETTHPASIEGTSSKRRMPGGDTGEETPVGVANRTALERGVRASSEDIESPRLRFEGLSPTAACASAAAAAVADAMSARSRLLQIADDPRIIDLRSGIEIDSMRLPSSSTTASTRAAAGFAFSRVIGRLRPCFVRSGMNRIRSGLVEPTIQSSASTVCATRIAGDFAEGRRSSELRPRPPSLVGESRAVVRMGAGRLRVP